LYINKRKKKKKERKATTDLIPHEIFWCTGELLVSLDNLIN
jgi:hypothetical protein